METQQKGKLNDKEIDSKILNIQNLMRYREWPVFQEVILHMQGLELSKLLKKSFMGLSPEEKDREHRAIVRVNDALGLLLTLPQWLEKRKPTHWQQVTQYLNEKEEDKK